MSKAKKALQSLTRRRYDPRNDASLIKEINDESSDRTFAIIHGALVEDALRRVLTKHFKALNQADEDALFEENGPLATFSSKIRIAYAMGALDKSQRNDANYIRIVRNAFAHTLLNLRFDDKEMTDVCMLLQLPDVSRLPTHQQTARWRFALSGAILQFQLSGLYKNMYLGRIPFAELVANGQDPLEK